jgi:hypothetical protein
LIWRPFLVQDSIFSTWRTWRYAGSCACGCNAA